MKNVVKQDKLVKKVYRACIDNNLEKLAELRKEEYRKIFKRKTVGKQFTPKWTLVQL